MAPKSQAEFHFRSLRRRSFPNLLRWKVMLPGGRLALAREREIQAAKNCGGVRPRGFSAAPATSLGHTLEAARIYRRLCACALLFHARRNWHNMHASCPLNGTRRGCRILSGERSCCRRASHYRKTCIFTVYLLFGTRPSADFPFTGTRLDLHGETLVHHSRLLEFREQSGRLDPRAGEASAFRPPL